MNPCTPNIQEAGLNKQEAEELAQRMMNLAKARGGNLDVALREIAGEIRSQDKLLEQINKRNALLNIRAKRSVKDFAHRFDTIGEGILTLIEGGSKVIRGARNSIDAQAKALHLQYFGRLVAELEKNDLLRRFKSGTDSRNFFIEMGELGKPNGQPGKTGDAEAAAIAKIVDGITTEQVARQNRAGAYIQKIPGYIIRQTHDIHAIRALGGLGVDRASKSKSYELWRDFTLPLIDQEKTFQGADPEKFMRNVHEALYTGVHGPDSDEAMVRAYGVTGSLAKKVSESRVLHFQDSDAAFKYNQQFGVKDFKEAILSDIHHRSRNIALMENLGPNPEATLNAAMQELAQESRHSEDAAKQVDSLRDWRIKAAYGELAGKNEHPASVTLNRIMTNTRILMQLSRMGGVVLSSLSDRAFLQSEAAYQGISHLQTLGAQLRSFAPKTGDEKQTLRLMGVGLDGLLGNALSRYSSHTTVGGMLHKVQQKFFSLNFLNAWTDSTKAAAGELFAAHLGEHANMPHEQLPEEIRRLLTMYDISPKEWDALRSTAYQHGDIGSRMITPDKVREIPREIIYDIAETQGMNPAHAPSIERAYANLETKLRSYLIDRVDIAVPTPGVAERKYATMGTQAGTPLGEAVRMLTLFKSFPLTILNRILGREIFGRGSMNVKQWLMNDTQGKFHLAQLMAMGTIAGYMSGVIRDGLKGRTPKPLITDDGSMNWSAINDAVVRGGSMGIMGDVLMADYDRGYKGFLSQQAGPIVGQMDTVADIKTRMQYALLGKGKYPLPEMSKFALDNTPLLNLFYVRPVMDYLVLWNLEEAMAPGSLHRMERAVENRNHQSFWLRPSDVVR